MSLRIRALLILLFLFLLFLPNAAVKSFCAFFIILFMLAFGYTRLIIRNLEIVIPVKTFRMHRNQETSVHFILSNTGILRAKALKIELSIGEMLSNERTLWAVELGKNEEIELSLSVLSTKRGLFVLGPVKISGCDPFGFFPWTKIQEAPIEVIVYPAIFPVHLHSRQGLPSGNLSTSNPIYEDITQYRSIREYNVGDELRRIQWKISAHLGKLYSLEYLPKMYFPMFILLNLNNDDYPVKGKYSIIENAIEITAGLLYYCLGLKQDFGFLSNGALPDGLYPSIAIRSGHSHAVQILESLALLHPGSNTEHVIDLLLAGRIDIPWGCRIIYTGPFLKEEQLKRLDILLRKGVNIDFIFIGPIPNRDSGITHWKSVQIYQYQEGSHELIQRN